MAQRANLHKFEEEFQCTIDVNASESFSKCGKVQVNIIIFKITAILIFQLIEDWAQL